MGLQNGKTSAMQRDLDDRIMGGLVVYWLVALISKCQHNILKISQEVVGLGMTTSRVKSLWCY